MKEDNDFAIALFQIVQFYLRERCVAVFDHGPQSKLPRQLYRTSLSGLDHVNRAAVPTVFDGKRHDAADAYEPQPKLNIAAKIFEAWLRDGFEADLVALAVDADFSFRGEVTMFKTFIFIALVARGFRATSSRRIDLKMLG